MSVNHLLTSTVIIATLLLSMSAGAQSEFESKLDSVTSRLESLEKKSKVEENLKISGYLQPQFTLQDDFENGMTNRFSLRRGRLRAEYSGEVADYVVQLEATERGVSLRDGFVRLPLPWVKSLSLTTGIFKHSFGFEGVGSSASRESPERARAYTSTFADPRDVGVNITFRPNKESRLSFLRADAGLFNGTGGTDFDNIKDFIGSVGVNSSLASGAVDYALKVSYRNGGHVNTTRNVYSMGIMEDGTPGFAVDSANTNLNARAAMHAIGANLEVGIKLPIGTTILRCEYFQGQQPGTQRTTQTPRTQPANTTDTYIRNYQGAILYLIQNITRTGHKVVVKYDIFDPNTEVSGSNIGRAGSKLSATDIAFSTIGFGWVYDARSRYRIMAYYEIPTNETSDNLDDYGSDRNDNLLTLRIQYRF